MASQNNCCLTSKDLTVIEDQLTHLATACRVAQGYAAISGRDYVLPDDIKRAAVPVLAHRIVFQNNFYHRGDLGVSLINSILDSVTVPSEQIDFSHR